MQIIASDTANVFCIKTQDDVKTHPLCKDMVSLSTHCSNFLTVYLSIAQNIQTIRSEILRKQVWNNVLNDTFEEWEYAKNNIFSIKVEKKHRFFCCFVVVRVVDTFYV